MKTPAGKECRFYYEDFYRGNSEQECRLVQSNKRSPQWKPRDCYNCRAPEILLANNNPNLVLEGMVRKGLLGLNRRVEIKAFCSKHLVDVDKPEVGCPHCARERPGLQQLLKGNN